MRARIRTYRPGGNRDRRLLLRRKPARGARGREFARNSGMLEKGVGEGQMGSALINGVTANFMFFDGTFWVLPLTSFYLPKSARAYLFSQSVKFHYFCSAPLVLTPVVRNQKAGYTQFAF